MSTLRFRIRYTPRIKSLLRTPVTMWRTVPFSFSSTLVITLFSF
jgi:hypothetical protein